MSDETLILHRRPLRAADETGPAPDWEPFGEAHAGVFHEAADEARELVASPLEPWKGDWIIAAVAPDDGTARRPREALFVVRAGETAEITSSRAAWALRWDGLAGLPWPDAANMVVDARRSMCGAAGLWPMLVMAEEFVGMRGVPSPGVVDLLRAFVAAWRRRSVAAGEEWLDYPSGNLVAALQIDLAEGIEGRGGMRARRTTVVALLTDLVSSSRSSAERVLARAAGVASPTEIGRALAAAGRVTLDAMVREHVAAELEAGEVQARRVVEVERYVQKRQLIAAALEEFKRQ